MNDVHDLLLESRVNSKVLASIQQPLHPLTPWHSSATASLPLRIKQQVCCVLGGPSIPLPSSAGIHPSQFLELLTVPTPTPRLGLCFSFLWENIIFLVIYLFIFHFVLKGREKQKQRDLLSAASLPKCLQQIVWRLNAIQDSPMGGRDPHP